MGTWDWGVREAEVQLKTMSVPRLGKPAIQNGVSYASRFERQPTVYSETHQTRQNQSQLPETVLYSPQRENTEFWLKNNLKE